MEWRASMTSKRRNNCSTLGDLNMNECRLKVARASGFSRETRNFYLKIFDILLKKESLLVVINSKCLECSLGQI